jgi:hypothetical protein
MAFIALMIYIEIISYFGVVWYMGIMQKRGKLTEQYFALIQVGYISLITVTGFLLAPMSLEVTFTWVVIMIIYWILGYPFARWLYRQLFQPR